MFVRDHSHSLAFICVLLCVRSGSGAEGARKTQTGGREPCLTGFVGARGEREHACTSEREASRWEWPAITFAVFSLEGCDLSPSYTPGNRHEAPPTSCRSIKNVLTNFYNDCYGIA